MQQLIQSTESTDATHKPTPKEDNKDEIAAFEVDESNMTSE